MQATYPFQKLCAVSPQTVVAAAGPHLYGIDLARGKVSWRHPPQHTASLKEANGSHHEDASNTEQDVEPASKRRKLDNATSTTDDVAAGSQPEPSQSRRSSQDSISITTDPRKKGERRKPKPQPSTDLPTANVSHVLTAQNGQMLVVITAEDKAISVYNLDSTGLERMSRRTMPKRMCAVALAKRKDREYLIVGDKFGDVWEVPVVEEEEWTPTVVTGVDAPLNLDGEKSASREKGSYEPSATELTVHTKGNLMALEQQRKLKEKKAKQRASHGLDQEMVKKEDESTTGRGPGAEFEGRLLLGHVSLLTDVAIQSISSPLGGPGTIRGYVLTSDRDEHVRISRYPQSHVIEGHCLGMKEFVSCVRMLEWAPTWAAVGTGEPSLRIFDWTTGTCLSTESFESESAKTDIEAVVQIAEDRDGKLAISGIWSVPVEGLGGVVLVALEGIPLLFSYVVSDKGLLQHHQTLRLPGNALGVAVLGSQASTDIVVSLDTVHAPASTLTYLDVAASRPPALVAFSLAQTAATKKWLPALDIMDRLAKAVAEVGDRPTMEESTSVGGTGGGTSAAGGPVRSGRKGSYSPMGEFLYGLENLRKKRGAAAAAEDPEEEYVQVPEEPDAVAGS